MTFDEEHALETYKSLISVSMEGLKTLLLVNGGAVVAIVAFLGQSSLGPGLAPHFWWPLGFFVAGVTSCTCAFIGSYFTQFSLYNEQFPGRKYQGPKHMVCLWVTFFLILLSVTCFALGAFSSISALSSNVEIKATQQLSAPAPTVSASSAANSLSSTPPSKTASSGIGLTPHSTGRPAGAR